MIEWFEIQSKLKRVKRDSNYDEEEIIFDSFYPFNKHKLISNEEFLEKNLKLTLHCSLGSYKFNDPEWVHQWYINDGCTQGFKLNITSAWTLGYTGKNVVISIIDDGLEKNNFDLIDNYDPNASYDFNDNDYDPQPRYDESNENKHGTRCAGEIAAKANNSFCGVGVAFNSKIGGIRLLDGKITDRLEAEAISYNLNYIDIFSASWGPLDDGRTVDGPGYLSKKAFENGVKFGRNGKGTIYVWAAGNGGRLNDNCNCDGYTSSIYTITIGSINQNGEMPVYSEKCSSILASTFSSGKLYQASVITSDLHNSCTKRHTGTSASAPIGAGIIALALEANQNLTWRDIQYLIIQTSSPFKLKSKNWNKNGIGKYFSHEYGYGLMNAGKMVELAQRWTIIGSQLDCSIKNYFIFNGVLVKKKNMKSFLLNFNKNDCKFDLNYLEHVISKITIEYGIRGRIKINLISPSNTRSNLLEFRINDLSNKGFNSWPFMSVHFWGENPYGNWYLEVINNGTEDVIIKEWSLKLYGIEKLPV